MAWNLRTESKHALNLRNAAGICFIKHDHHRKSGLSSADRIFASGVGSVVGCGNGRPFIGIGSLALDPRWRIRSFSRVSDQCAHTGALLDGIAPRGSSMGLRFQGCLYWRDLCRRRGGWCGRVVCIPCSWMSPLRCLDEGVCPVGCSQCSVVFRRSASRSKSNSR